MCLLCQLQQFLADLVRLNWLNDHQLLNRVMILGYWWIRELVMILWNWLNLRSLLWWPRYWVFWQYVFAHCSKNNIKWQQKFGSHLNIWGNIEYVRIIIAYIVCSYHGWSDFKHITLKIPKISKSSDTYHEKAKKLIKTSEFFNFFDLASKFFPSHTYNLGCTFSTHFCKDY